MCVIEKTDYSNLLEQFCHYVPGRSTTERSAAVRFALREYHCLAADDCRLDIELAELSHAVNEMQATKINAVNKRVDRIIRYLFPATVFRCGEFYGKNTTDAKCRCNAI